MPWRVVVVGRSMEPTLLDGDHVLVVPAWAGARQRLRVGDLVVVQDPASDRLLVKRVVALPGQTAVLDGRVLEAGAGILVLGDNAAASTDSRDYGALSLELVRGRAWYRYAPADSVGRLDRPPPATA